MKLFVDTGSIKEIETIAALGILDGVTTNPSLLAKEPGDFRQNLKKICDIVKGPVSGEVTATDFAGMIREGHDIASIDEHMVVKVPLTRDGIRACKAMSGEGLRVNVTLCFSAAQALLVASCRHPIHVVEAARLGADIATCPAAVIEALFNHPLTSIGLEKFLKDWEKSQAVKA
jgi:transaldolase